MIKVTDIAIAVLSLSGIGLSYYKAHDLRRYGCLCGLAAQPLWIYHIWATESWGIAPVAPAYTALYLYAAHQHWR